MTNLVAARRRVALRLSTLKIEALAFALVMLCAVAAALVAAAGPRASALAQPAPASQSMPANAAALVAVTSGAAASEVTAVGDRAKLINAAMPFSSAPVQAARPFALMDDETDHDRALLCLTQAVYYEAGFEPPAGRRAVAQVVLNRMRHPAFPKSVCGVVYQGARLPVCQFSFVCDGSLYRAPAAGAWREAREVARAALAGYVEAAVGSATHYHADYVAPRWASMLTKITKLGAHIFYRWPGAWGERGAFTGRYTGEPSDAMALRPAPPKSGTAAVAEQVAPSGPVTDGTLLKRAPTDVGGLLDVSKGWTLSIPTPDEIAGASSRVFSDQQPAADDRAVASIAARAPVAGSR